MHLEDPRLYVLHLICCRRSTLRGTLLAVPIAPWPLTFLTTSFCPTFCFNVPFLLAIEAFNVRLVFTLPRLSSKGLVFRLLISFLADHALIIIVADEFDNTSWIDGIASLISVCSDHAKTHFIAGRKGCDKNIHILLIRHALAHSCQLFTKISKFREMSMYII